MTSELGDDAIQAWVEAVREQQRRNELCAEIPDAPPLRWLTTFDRCDRCNAPAKVVTDHAGSELMWCVHHYSRYKAALGGLVVHDERVR